VIVWTGSQRPFGVRSELAQHPGVPEDRVHVVVRGLSIVLASVARPGIRHEAARLAKATGKPVKRNWTREEEMTWAYFPSRRADRGGRQAEPRGRHRRVGVPQLQLRRVGAPNPYEVGSRKEQVH
jgi:isoquinoline 1-oxidoreductase